MARADGRADDELRPVSFELDVQPTPPGSVLVRQRAAEPLLR